MESNPTFDFSRDVLEASHRRPVLVDFWAAWCGPCRMLGPVLDQLAQEQADRWDLVKLDTEAHQDLAAQFAIRSIPHVKLFYQGVPIADFSGALPRTAILQWLDEHLPDPVRQAWSALAAQLPAWPAGECPPALLAFVREHPAHEPARLHYLAYQVLQEPQAARTAVQGIGLGHPQEQMAEAIRTLAEWVEGDWNEATPGAAAVAEARSLLLNGQLEAAFQRLIDGLMRDKAYHQEIQRRILIAMFHLRGESDPLVVRFRRWFAMALH